MGGPTGGGRPGLGDATSKLFIPRVENGAAVSQAIKQKLDSHPLPRVLGVTTSVVHGDLLVR